MKSLKKLSVVIAAIAFIGFASSFSNPGVQTTSTPFYMANHLPYTAQITVNFQDGTNSTVSIPGGGAAYTLDTKGRTAISTTIEGLTVPVGQVAYFNDLTGHLAQMKGDGMTGGQPIDPNEIN